MSSLPERPPANDLADLRRTLDSLMRAESVRVSREENLDPLGYKWGTTAAPYHKREHSSDPHRESRRREVSSRGRVDYRVHRSPEDTRRGTGERDVATRDRGDPGVSKHRSAREVQAPHFDAASISFKDYLRDFERVAQYNEWTKRDKQFHLRNSIVGNAKLRIKTMPDPAGYDDLVSQLLIAFSNDRTTDTYRNQMASVKRAASMDLESYGHHLLDLARQAHPSAGPEEQERIATEKFMDTAGSRNLSVWLKALKPRTMLATIDLAVQFEHATASHVVTKPKGGAADNELSLASLLLDDAGTPDGVVTASVAPGSAKDFPLEERVKRLVEDLFKKHQRSGANKRPPVKRDDIRCFNCHELGHMVRNCPHLKTAALN